MSFYESSEWTLVSQFHNPEAFHQEMNYRKTSYDISNLSTRKDSTDSVDLKFRYKTQVCKYWLNQEYCPFESFCSFAHGFVEKRSRQDLTCKYKTKLCKNWINHQFCSYGSRCQFLHPQQINQNAKNKVKYQTFLNLIKQDPKLSFLYLKRLNVFNQITDQSVMKQLMGQSYNSITCLQQKKPFCNSKPRFNSI